jgi:endonuclease-3
MPTAINKQRLLSHILTTLKNRYRPEDSERRPVLEQFLYAICREGVTRKQADRAFHSLHEHFFDWNEIRVSSPREIAEALGELPNAEERAQRLISLLQEVFESTFTFDLDCIQKKGLKQAIKQLARFQAANDFTVSWVIQHALGGHAIPIDIPSVRVLQRMGLLESDDSDLESLRTALEHLVPKARGALFAELISELADELCLEDEPQCASCPLASDCMTGQETARRSVSGRSSRPKPR